MVSIAGCKLSGRPAPRAIKINVEREEVRHQSSVLLHSYCKQRPQKRAGVIPEVKMFETEQETKTQGIHQQVKGSSMCC